jgi:hypothetical protein
LTDPHGNQESPRSTASAQSAASLREQARAQFLNSLGGWSGTVVTAVPPVVFVVVDALAGLRPAIFAAVGAGVLMALYRLIRRQPLQQAITGLLSVAVAAAIAARTGQARGYFLLGIAAAICYAAVFAVSLAVRRPLVGVIWEFLDPSEPTPDDRGWRHRPRLRRAYDLATLAATGMFVARAVVQGRLFSDNKTGWLAVARIAMGYPLYILVVGYAFWVVRRARSQDAFSASEAAGAGGATAAPRLSAADGGSDGGLGLGEGDEE